MKRKPIWTKYFIFYLVGVVVTALIISVILFARVYSDKEMIINTNANNIIYFSDLNLSEKLTAIETRFGGITLATSFRTVSEQESQYYTAGNNYQSIINSLCADYNDVLSVFFVDTEGKSYSAGESMGGLSERLEKMESARNRPEFQKRRRIWFYERTTNGHNACALYTEIVYIGNDYIKQPLGEILIYVDTERLNDDYFVGVEDGTGVVFVDCYGKIVVASEKSLVGVNYDECFEEKGNIIVDVDGRNYFFNATESRINGWTNISYFDTGLTAAQTYEMFAVMLIAISLCIAGMAIVSYFIAKKLGKPIDELFRYIRVSNTGEVVMPDNGNNNETQEIKEIFDNITEKLQGQIGINYQKEIELKNALIKSYESQMNPHFLYNTLQTIQMLSVIGRNDDVNNITTYLGKMLRFNLDNSNTVTFGQEIENIEYYFKILKLRYMDGFDYKILIDEKLYDCEVLKFILQPFVENSINHGFKNKQGLWEIVITASEINGELAIVIRDNGTGIDESRLSELKQKLATGETSGRGIGIRNVNVRIKLTYGEEYGVDIFSNSTTQVIIHIPCVRGNGEEGSEDV